MNAWTLVEWPERAEDALPRHRRFDVTITDRPVSMERHALDASIDEARAGFDLGVPPDMAFRPESHCSAAYRFLMADQFDQPMPSIRIPPVVLCRATPQRVAMHA